MDIFQMFQNDGLLLKSVKVLIKLFQSCLVNLSIFKFGIDFLVVMLCTFYFLKF